MNVPKEITPFNFEGYAVRTVMVAGEPWFIARDVCTSLGIENVSQAVGNFPENEVLTISSTYSQKVARYKGKPARCFCGIKFRPLKELPTPSTEKIKTNITELRRS
jgi:hypothetical protein